MKALYFEQHGDLDQVKYGDVPDPEPAPGEVLFLLVRPDFADDYGTGDAALPRLPTRGDCGVTPR